MDPSTGSSLQNSLDLDDKSSPQTSKSANERVKNETANSDTSLASNLETSLNLTSPNFSSKSDQPASNNNSNSAYRNCYNCNTADTTLGKSTSTSEHSHANSNANSDSSKSNVPKYGISIPNRVFVGGIPLDVSRKLDLFHCVFN